MFVSFDDAKLYQAIPLFIAYVIKAGNHVTNCKNGVMKYTLN